MSNIETLQGVMEDEAKLFLKRIKELEGDELYEFIRLVAQVPPPRHHSAVAGVIHVARNIKNIEQAIDEFYVG